MELIKYIPGDLVSVYVGIEKYIVEVIDTKNEDKVFLYKIKFSNGEIQYADNGNIVPIPLTPEILDKNGWEHKNDTYWKHYPYFDLVIYIKERGLHIASVKDAIYLREVKYVHQLQQGLFGLNLDSNINI